MGDLAEGHPGSSDDPQGLGALRRKLQEMEGENVRLRINLESARSSMSQYEVGPP